MTGILGFIILGYFLGILAAMVALGEISSLSRRAWRHSGRRRRSWQISLGLSWIVFGWGGVIATVVWFAGDARSQVRQISEELEVSQEIDLSFQEAFATRMSAIAMARQSYYEINLVEEANSETDFGS
jgi:hypothetical protein